jgi:GNAT superfamily N-acetyltransferase
MRATRAPLAPCSANSAVPGAAPPSPRALALRPLGRPGDRGWVVERHGAVYAEQFGWDASFEALVARIVADYAERHDARREAAWIAEVDGTRAGCVFCVAHGGEVAQLRILHVDPGARGLGLGRRLVDRCVAFAREAGYRELTPAATASAALAALSATTSTRMRIPRRLTTGRLPASTDLRRGARAGARAPRRPRPAR